jgi:RNA-splicing ligase RtcB
MTKKQIEGAATTATVMTAQYDETTEEQIREIADHEAFQNPIRVMPDCHAGAGAVIGFTMPISRRVVPNTVGVDIGCGMSALRLGQPEFHLDVNLEQSEKTLQMIDDKVRDAVPMGRNVYDFEEQDYHIVNDFPWDDCQATLKAFAENHEWMDLDAADWFNGYGKDYFTGVCQRIGYDSSRAINSLGTLGGGNHFIEISRSQAFDDLWVVVHSGSRGIGLSIAQHWQDKATDYTSARKNIEDVPKDVRPYLKDNWKPDADAIREDFEGEEIQEVFDSVSQAIQEYGPSTDNRNTDLDYLEGDEAVGYVIDMIFAQRYASESRKQMCGKVAEAVGVGDEPMAEEDFIESTHNYIDFRDGVIRKGATRAHEGERLIIPFNMRDGTIVCRGQGNDEWNRSAPHGAGRRMSRTRAFEELSLKEFEDAMSDVFSTSVTEETLDEAPMAYKDTAVVESVIDESAEIIDRWMPVLNIKAEE